MEPIAARRLVRLEKVINNFDTSPYRLPVTVGLAFVPGPAISILIGVRERETRKSRIVRVKRAVLQPAFETDEKLKQTVEALVLAEVLKELDNPEWEAPSETIKVRE